MQGFIVAALRTVGGKRGGRLSGWHPADLSAQVINALMAQTGAAPALAEDVIWGCVSQVGHHAHPRLAAQRRPLRPADHVQRRRHGQQ